MRILAYSYLDRILALLSSSTGFFLAGNKKLGYYEYTNGDIDRPNFEAIHNITNDITSIYG